MTDGPFTLVEALRRVLAELGEAPPQQIAAVLAQQYGVRLEPRFVPVVLASLKELELLEQARQAAKVLREQLRAAQPPHKDRARRTGKKAQKEAVQEPDQHAALVVRADLQE
jgi:hypothetical protein